VFPTIYIPGSYVLLHTVNYDIDAVNDAGNTAAALKSAGYRLGASYAALRPEDRIVINLNLSGTYVAWSPWGIPADTGGNSGSTCGFCTVFTNNTLNNRIVTGTPYDGYAAARAAFQSQFPDGVEFTGSSDYWFGIQDTPVGDNSGGMSITVEVYGRER
jgi:hypothetical protein